MLLLRGRLVNNAFFILIMIIITKVEDDDEQVFFLGEALMNQIDHEGNFKELINLLHVQIVSEDFVQECKVILVYLEVSVEFSLTILLASLIVEFNQESDLKIQILRFSGYFFSD